MPHSSLCASGTQAMFLLTCAYHQYCTLPKGSGHSFALHPSQMFLNLTCDVIRSIARSRLCVHTLHFETATWNQRNFSPCDLCADPRKRKGKEPRYHTINTTGMDQERMLFCVLHHLVDAETFNILPGEKIREVFQWGLVEAEASTPPGV